MLNLSARNAAYDSYAQSATEIYPRKNRLMASTGFSNLNSSMHAQRLPQLSRSFSSSKSTKLKLTTLEASLSSILQQLQELRMDTRESRRYCNFLKDDLGQSKLGMLNLQLMTHTNKFEKTFKLSKKYDQERTRALKKDCDSSRLTSQNIRSMCSTLQCKMDNLQNIMGIYSAKEKHKQ